MKTILIINNEKGKKKKVTKKTKKNGKDDELTSAILKLLYITSTFIGCKQRKLQCYYQKCDDPTNSEEFALDEC